MSKVKKAPAKKKQEYVYALKSVNADMTAAHNGFVWPKKGKVVAPDWDGLKQCGGGLHALLWGAGQGGLLNHNEDAKWLVLKVPADSFIDLDGKIKFPECEVVYCGVREEAVKMITELGGGNFPVVFGTATAGYLGTATAGKEGTIILKYWLQGKLLMKVAVVGEDGIKPGVAYKLDDQFNFVEANPLKEEEVVHAN